MSNDVDYIAQNEQRCRCALLCYDVGGCVFEKDRFRVPGPGLHARKFFRPRTLPVHTQSHDQYVNDHIYIYIYIHINIIKYTYIKQNLTAHPHPHIHIHTSTSTHTNTRAHTHR